MTIKETLGKLIFKSLEESGIEYEVLTYEELVDEHFNELSNEVASITWQNGSFAFINEFKGYFIAQDEAEIYGPFKSIDEAKIASGLDKPERTNNPIIDSYGI